MHIQLARGPALVAVVLLQYGQNEALLELAHRFGVQNVALVHLHNQCFKLISHGISLSESVVLGDSLYKNVECGIYDRDAESSRPSCNKFSPW